MGEQLKKKEILASIVLYLDLSSDFLGIQNNLKIRGSARVCRPHSSTNALVAGKPRTPIRAEFQLF